MNSSTLLDLKSWDASLRRRGLGLFLAIVSLCGGATDPTAASPSTRAPVYQADWSSLRRHVTPPWLQDAKFGIYCHWGIQTLSYIPAYSQLSTEKLIELWKGEKFDANEWAALFEAAGAKFGGVIGWHGSDFKHWDSDISDFNSARMGPRIDVVGEVAKAVRKRGLKFLVSYHSIKEPTWLGFAKEGVEKYNPDIFWVDASFGGTKGAENKKAVRLAKYIGKNDAPVPAFPEKYQRDFIAHFFNHAAQRNQEVEFVYKSYDIPPGVGMRDLENGILANMAYDTWMTDMDMSVPPDWKTHGWFYREGVRLRSANELVDMLVDVVSKNGVFLLNVPPMADGSFPAEVKTTLGEVGKWLKQNGAAIYGTSPWFLYGEGPTEIPDGNYTYHHNNHFAQIAYTKDDIRFSVKGDSLYVICLGRPEGVLRVGALNSSFKVQKGDIAGITHLSTGKRVGYDHGPQALSITMEGLELDEMANVFKVELVSGP